MHVGSRYVVPGEVNVGFPRSRRCRFPWSRRRRRICRRIQSRPYRSLTARPARTGVGPASARRHRPQLLLRCPAPASGPCSGTSPPGATTGFTFGVVVRVDGNDLALAKSVGAKVVRIEFAASAPPRSWTARQRPRRERRRGAAARRLRDAFPPPPMPRTCVSGRSVTARRAAAGSETSSGATRTRSVQGGSNGYGGTSAYLAWAGDYARSAVAAATALQGTGRRPSRPARRRRRLAVGAGNEGRRPRPRQVRRGLDDPPVRAGAVVTSSARMIDQARAPVGPTPSGSTQRSGGSRPTTAAFLGQLWVP